MSPSVSTKGWKILRPISASSTSVPATDSYVAAEKVKNAWLGFGDEYQFLLQTFDEYLNDFEKNRIGKDCKASMLENYCKQYRRLVAFLQYKYKLEDIPLRELQREFIGKYVVYLSTVRGMLPGTLPNAIKKLKLMSYTALKNSWIASDPFAGFWVTGKYRDRRLLSESEL